MEKERARFARMAPGTHARKSKEHADKHEAQVYGWAPLVPFHHVVFDPMHGIHSEVNALMEEAVHKPLVFGFESKSPQVVAVCTKAMDEVNKLWADAKLQRLVQFGRKDGGKGDQHSHALNGPSFKKAWGKPHLLLETIKAMLPVYELKECVDLHAPIIMEGEGDSSGDNGESSSGGTSGEQPSQAQKKQRRADRGAAFDAAQPARAPKAQERQRKKPQPPPKVPFSQRVGMAFIALIYLYEFITKGHGEKASDADAEERSKRADHAVELALQLQRAMIAVCGTYRRRTYAHDLVYGMHNLYTLFAKPWNAATEGSEHKHQQIKKFFAHLVCHNERTPHGSAYQMLHLDLVKENLVREFGASLLPQSNDVARRVNCVLAPQKKRNPAKKKAGPKGVKADQYSETEEESGMVQACGCISKARFMRGASPCVP